ncbi:hypothetical protein [Rugosimonospora africana]|uniref:Transposase n=1 Tax=Rugosimonospora africana TaxID=556532 RepID=A0A8J3VS01_9ACTN|nr:hypothetical protein [Rugosimonospora africana]GIH16031.1 hypothetical protein Raf01_42030 [Rugosimonospora africana]
MPTLVQVAGIRWCVEESIQAVKGHVGLDHYQVRGSTPWHHFITLAMLALAFLTMLATTAAPPADPDPHHPARGRDPIPRSVVQQHHHRLPGSTSPSPPWPGTWSLRMAANTYRCSSSRVPADHTCGLHAVV